MVQNQSIPPTQIVNQGTVVEHNLVHYHPPGVSVPRFVGMPIEEAHNVGQSLGLNVQVNPATSARTRLTVIGERPGVYVENQSSPAGTIVARGAAVELTIVRLVAPRPRMPR